MTLERMPWTERLEASLVHLGDYEPADAEHIAREEGREVGRSLLASPAETRGGEHSAQVTRADFENIDRDWLHFTAAVCAALAVVLRPLVGRTPWTGETARGRATRPRSR